MIKECEFCDSGMPALSCGTVCSPGCRTQSKKGVVRKKDVVATSVRKPNLSDIFYNAVLREEGAFEHFFESVQNNPATVEGLARYYFECRYDDWKAERDEKPKCNYCGEIARDGSHFCCDECEREDFEHEQRRKAEADRRAQRNKERLEKGLPLKNCYHCGSAFKTLDGHMVYCTPECHSDALKDRRKNGPICIQCDQRFRMVKGGGRSVHHCYSCSTKRNEELREMARAEQEKLQKEYEEYREFFTLGRENEIRSRELRSIKQLTAEQRAKLRHYGDLTKSIDKGELISVASK